MMVKQRKLSDLGVGGVLVVEQRLCVIANVL